ncbi:MAG: hypothetical protein ACM3N0_06300 [Chloroflexota bacterium]
MCRFEVRQIDLVALAAGNALQRHEIDEGANRRIHTVDAANVGAGAKVGEAHPGHLLGEQVEVTVAGRLPALDLGSNPLDVVRVGIKYRIDAG